MLRGMMADRQFVEGKTPAEEERLAASSPVQYLEGWLKGILMQLNGFKIDDYPYIDHGHMIVNTAHRVGIDLRVTGAMSAADMEAHQIGLHTGLQSPLQEGVEV